MTALPSTVRVKAEAGGGLDNCRSSENSRLIISPCFLNIGAGQRGTLAPVVALSTLEAVPAPLVLMAETR